MTEPKTETKIKEHKKEKPMEDEVVSMRQLLECGVHFGHQTKRWNPKMKKYIFTSRNGIHVIDLQQSIQLIKDAYHIVKDIASKGGSVLFVGTKKQAQDAVQSEADRSGMPYVNHRWLGGTLTNNQTLQQSIQKLKGYERLREEGVLDTLSNKEASKRLKAYTRHNYYLEGIKNMKKLPSVLFVIDTQKEQLAIDEANKLGIPIIGIVDTNANPTEVQYPIPANDDAIRAIKLLCSIIAQAVIDGQNSATNGEEASVEEQLLAKNEAAKAEAKTEKQTAKVAG